jgi:RecJ-like exonuclease
MDSVSISKVTAKQLRNMERAVYNKKEPCHVCGGKNSVTVLHHLLPLERVAELINAGLCEINISRKAVWLCPTCHAYVHKYIREVNKGHSLKDVADKYYKETLYAYKIGLLVCESHKEEQKILQEKIKLFELLEGTEAVQ